VTQNNGFDQLYQSQRNNCANWVHIALMGDPTLRMQIVAPPASVKSATDGSNVQLSWTPANDSVEGYNIYRAADANAPFSRVNTTPVTGYDVSKDGRRLLMTLPVSTDVASGAKRDATSPLQLQLILNAQDRLPR